MAERRIVPLQFDVGLDTGADPRTTVGLSRAQNAVYRRRGALQKRPGRDRLSTAFTGQYKPTHMVELDGRALAFGDGGFALCDADGTQWAVATAADGALVCDVERESYIGVPDVVHSLDACFGDDFFVIAYSRNDPNSTYPEAIYVNVYDLDSKQLSATTTYTNAYTGNICSVRLLRVGDDVHLYYVFNTSTLIYGTKITSPTAIGPSFSMGVSANAGSGAGVDVAYFDGCVVPNSGGDPIVVLFYKNASNDMEARFLPNGETTGASTVSVATPDVYGGRCTCFARDDTHVDLVWNNQTNRTIDAVSYDATGSPPSVYIAANTWPIPGSTYVNDEPFALCGINAHRSDAANRTTAYAMFFEGFNDLDPPVIKEIELRNNASTMALAVTDTINGAHLATKPIRIDDSDWLVGIMARSLRGSRLTAQDTFFWLAIYGTDPKQTVPVAQAAKYRAALPCRNGSAYRDHSGLPGVHSQGGRYWSALPYTVNREISTVGQQDASVYSIDLYGLKLSSVDVQDLSLDRAAFIAGSIPYVCDGRYELFEQGFLMYPEELQCTAVAGSDLIADTIYDYKATYERVDRRGYRWQSAPTPTTSSATTTSSNRNIEVLVPTLSITRIRDWDSPLVAASRGDGVNIVLWRKKRTDQVFRRVSSTPNDSSVAELTITDDVADVSISTNERLYTTGGKLEALSPAPYRAAMLHDGRLFVANRERERTEIEYTRKLVPYEAPAFSDSLLLRVPELGGRITAMVDDHDRGIVFKESAIFGFDGVGLTDLAGGSNYRVYQISDKLGCNNCRAIAKTPDAVLFATGGAGIYGLRSNRPSPVGDPVRYHNTTQTIEQAFAVPESSEAVFLCSDGPSLVFNWYYQKWSTWENHDAISGICIGQAALYYGTESGEIWAEDGTNFDDNGVFVPLDVITAWIYPGNFGGYGRLREIALIGDFRADADLKIEIGWDNEPSWDDSPEYEAGANLAASEYGAYFGDGLTPLSTYADKAMIVRIWPSRRKCTSFRLRIYDEQSDGGSVTSAGFALVGMAVDLAPKRGVHKAGTARQAGV